MILNQKDITSLIPKRTKDKPFLGQKRLGQKDNNEIQDFNKGNKPKNKRKRHLKFYSRNMLIKKLSNNNNRSSELWKYYYSLYIKTIMKD